MYLVANLSTIVHGGAARARDGDRDRVDVDSRVTALLVTDYRGALTSYTHRCWLTYQRPWYQRTFLWTASSRARHADENRLRRTFRIVAVIGLAMGVFILSIEFSALVTGHVS